jgi:hypothetical protein
VRVCSCAGCCGRRLGGRARCAARLAGRRALLLRCSRASVQPCWLLRSVPRRSRALRAWLGGGPRCSGAPVRACDRAGCCGRRLGGRACRAPGSAAMRPGGWPRARCGAGRWRGGAAQALDRRRYRVGEEALERTGQRRAGAAEQEAQAVGELAAALELERRCGRAVPQQESQEVA